MAITSDVQKLVVEGKITLYQLDFTNYAGGGVLYFHGHVNFHKQFDVADTLESKIVFMGQEYSPIPIKCTGLEQRIDGKASSPTLEVGNYLNNVQGGLSALCLQYKDLAAAKLTIIKTFVKYLDAVNFADPQPNIQSDYNSEIWYIEQKTAETSQALGFSLSNPVDFEGAFVPSRLISKRCEWALKNGYRQEECGYIGTAFFTDKDQPTDDPSKDKCSGTLNGCKLRFGENEPLPFGGFPAAGMI